MEDGQFVCSCSFVHDCSHTALNISKKAPISKKQDSNNPKIPTQSPTANNKSNTEKQERLKDRTRSTHLGKRSRCVHCHLRFVNDENQRGSCKAAPDKVAECINLVSCMQCAHLVLYHCMADAEKEYGPPCVCDTSDDNNLKNWTALTLLSLCVPCLCCFLPLSACHWCGVACGCCGGQHKAA